MVKKDSIQIPEHHWKKQKREQRLENKGRDKKRGQSKSNKLFDDEEYDDDLEEQYNDDQ